MLSISERDVFLTFGTLVANEGDEYQKSARVLSANLSPNGKAVTGEVQGSVLDPYSVQIRAASEGLKCSCSCSMQTYCKHSAALLFDLIRGGRVNRVAVKNALSAQEEQKGLYYILEPQSNPHRVELKIVHAARTAAGAWSLIQKGELSRITQRSASYISQDDFEIARSFLASTRNANWIYRNAFPDTGDLGERLLKRIISTGRAYWKELGASPLTMGPEKHGKVDWKVGTSGRQIPFFNTGTRGDITIFVGVPWYVNARNASAGSLKVEVSNGTLRSILSAGPMDPSSALQFWQTLLRADKNIPAPIKQVEMKKVLLKPSIVLNLNSVEKHESQTDAKTGAQTDGPTGAQTDVKEHLSAGKAELKFDYGTLDFQGKSEKRVVKNNVVTIYQRDLVFEKQHIAELESCGLVCATPPEARGSAASLVFTAASPVSWLRFTLKESSKLKENGWQVRADRPCDFNVVKLTADWTLGLSEGTDFWFSLDLGVEFEGNKIQLLPIIRNALRALKMHSEQATLEVLSNANVDGIFYAEIGDGRFLALPFERVKIIVESFLWLMENGNVGASVQMGSGTDAGTQIRTDAGAGAGTNVGASVGASVESSVGTIEGSSGGTDATARESVSLPQLFELSSNLQHIAGSPNFQFNECLKELLERIRRRTNNPTALSPPPEFNAELRGYQLEGMRWLDFLREFSLGGILADDMGLGKTIQALAHFCVEKSEGRLDKPVLVICPSSVLPNWKSEIDRFAPHLSTLSLWGIERSKNFPEIKNADLVLTTYSLLSRDIDVLSKQAWKAVVLDEAQMIKNPDAQVTQNACRLRSEYRICLTGTPIENNLGELWSQFNFLMPGFLLDRSEFAQSFRFPIEKHQDLAKRRLLSDRVRPFLLRRTKELVAKELPEKTVILKRVELEGAQRDLYETIRLAMSEKLNLVLESKGFERSKIVILDALLKLRQVCCDSRLLKMDQAKSVTESAKLDALLNMLDELQQEGRRVLLFSQFTSMLDLIIEELNKRKMEFVEIRGSTRDRVTPVKRFQSGEVFLFLLSLKSGGVGLNLTAADTVIHYDPWWNPAVENQASDRAHRIGQDKSVFVFKLIAAGTIEERILELQERKRVIAESVLDEDADLPFELTEDDIANLLKPLV